MDPRKLFSDSRLRGLCAYCCGPPETRDHVPSKVFLDSPMPNDLPVVECCLNCNNGFSRDEEYTAALIECAICGTVDANRLSRVKISLALQYSPALQALIAESTSSDDSGQLWWNPDMKRIHNVLEKLARGHAAYELNILPADDPAIEVVPITMFNAESRDAFLEDVETPFFPEIGSRAFSDPQTLLLDTWKVVQQGRYEYLVTQAYGTAVRMLISDYLACEVLWD